MIISRSVLLRMTDVSDSFVEKIQTLAFCLVIFFLENLAVHEIMWKNV
jgi:hypothetical protein